MKCPSCHSTELRKNGRRYGKQCQMMQEMRPSIRKRAIAFGLSPRS